MKVFWSWQSDTPGRTGRNLVRDALDAAIQELKQLSDVEEPHERENKEALHLDHDRKGVRGSPPLADTILAKIDSSQVFIADVTPVAVVLGDKEGDPIKKRTMNPNVAIELGYALKVLGSDILMVLNEHYGVGPMTSSLGSWPTQRTFSERHLFRQWFAADLSTPDG